MLNTGKYIEEEVLLAQICLGDTAAFKQLFFRYYDTLYSTALMYLKAHEEAEDVVQQTFCNLWEHREKLTEVKNIGGYIFVMARNEILSLVRRKATYNNCLIKNKVLCAASGKDNPEAILMDKEQQEILSKIIQKLPKQQQKAYRLSRDQDQSYEQIAHEMNLSISTVKGHISAALRSIRMLVKAQEKELF